MNKQKGIQETLDQMAIGERTSFNELIFVKLKGGFFVYTSNLATISHPTSGQTGYDQLYSAPIFVSLSQINGIEAFRQQMSQRDLDAQRRPRNTI